MKTITDVPSADRGHAAARRGGRCVQTTPQPALPGQTVQIKEQETGIHRWVSWIFFFSSICTI